MSTWQWYEIETSGDHVITCDDFVIPNSENGSALRLTHSPGPYASATRIARTDETLTFGPCCQEEAMWEAFAACAKAPNAADAARRHVDAAIKTHACLMAIVRACEAGGDVDVPRLEDY